MTFAGLITEEGVNTSSGSQLSVVLYMLQEYVEYNLSVRAFNGAGPGPFSPEIAERTLEDGECLAATTEQ